MRYVLVITALAAAASTGPSQSREFPVMDVEASCQTFANGMSASGDAPRNAALNICMKDQQEGYDASRALWGRISDARQNECVDRAERQGANNFYQALARCALDRYTTDERARETNKLNSPTTAPFRY